MGLQRCGEGGRVTAQSAPQGLDPLLLNHWLWWKLLCHEADGDAFQRLFEKVMQQVEPTFVRVRPYGNIGDRKNDGMLLDDEAGVVYQVYSPDELKQSETKKKIEEDLAGAAKHWSEKGLRKWVFVYNVRRGLPPDIPAVLVDQAKLYPDLELDHMPSDALWEHLRGLSLQKRSEILGAPTGYEHLFFYGGDAGGDTLARIQNGCFVLAHDPMVPFNMASVAAAIQPRSALGPPLHLSPLVEDEDWIAAFRHQREVVSAALARSGDLVPRFAVFSIAPIPLIVHLGFLFSDRVETDLFQFDRDRGDWSWPDEQSETAEQVPELVGEPESEVAGDGDAVLRVSLSELVRAADTRAVVPSPLVELAIGIDDPDKQWLQSPEQLSHLRELYLAALKSIRRKVPCCGRLHVFYAGPAAGAFLLGQCVNPRMDPETAVYEYSRQREPRYRLAGVLTEEGAL